MQTLSVIEKKLTPLKELRVGFIGAGRHSTANLYPAFALTGVPIVAIAERNPERAREAATRGYAPQIFADHHALLRNSRLDAVVVSLAPELQIAVVEDCIRAGVGVFVEKPLGFNADSAQRIAQLALAHRSPVMLGFMKRFAPAYVRLKNMIGADNELGSPSSYVCVFGCAPWKPDMTHADLLIRAAVHLVDLVRSLFGDVAEVSAELSSTAGATTIAATFRHTSGVVGSLTFVLSGSWARETEELTVICDRGTARIFDLVRVEVWGAGPVSPAANPWADLSESAKIFGTANSPESGTLRDIYLRGFAGEMAHFVSVLRGDEELTASVKDNVSTMQTCDRILHAISS